MKFLIETGRLKSAKGWLPKFEAEEALGVVQKLHAQGTKEIHIYDAESFASVTEGELAREAYREH